MHALLHVAALAALTPFSTPPQSVTSPASDGEPLVPAIVVHCGDGELLDRLKRAGEVWSEAGDFAVCALTMRDLAALDARGLRTHPLHGVGPEDELFLVDLERTDPRTEIDPSSRIEFRLDRMGVVSVPAERHASADRAQPGHTCSAEYAAIRRAAMRPLQPVLAAGAGAGQGGAALSTHDPLIQTLVDQVSDVNLEALVQSYSTYPNRNAMHSANYTAAKAQLIAQLQSYGYAPVQESWSGAYGPNVVVTIPGKSHPNRHVVIGAHFDARNYASSSVSALCPGADDNTSGSAGVLEIARILQTAGPFHNSIRLIWFSAEEFGNVGSTHHASRMRLNSERVIGMLNMDMIAYRDPLDVRDCDFATNSTSPWLTSFCLQTSPLYVWNWAAVMNPYPLGGFSDHMAFHSAGFHAVIFREDLIQPFPDRHTPADTYPNATTDFELAQMIVRGVLACAATLAEPVQIVIDHAGLPDVNAPSAPYVVDADLTSNYGATVVGATLRHRVSGAPGWTSTPMSIVSGSTWRATIPDPGSPRVVEYYIEAADDQGRAETAPKGAESGGRPFEFAVGVRSVAYATDFDGPDDGGWTHGAAYGEDDWERGVPLGKGDDPGALASSGNVWGNDLGAAGANGLYAASSHNWLRSPSIDCTGFGAVILEFRRWLSVDAAPFDRARIAVNGQLVWTSDPFGALDYGWTPVRIDISSIAADNPAVQVEFSLQSDGDLNFGGWNIDDFALVRVEASPSSCPVATYCTAKVNSDGCAPQISGSGLATPSSLFQFNVTARDVIGQKAGVLFYGYAPSATPFQAGFKCVAGAPRRCPVQNSGGTPPPDTCTGVLSYDFNLRIRSGNDPQLVPGTTIFAQWWYRDGADPTGHNSGLSDALQFVICP